MNPNDPTRHLESEFADSSLTEPRLSWGRDDAMPVRIGRYRIEKRIGRGGFGLVYLAYDERLDRRVAIKVPHPDLVAHRDAANFYLQEARTVAHLEHPSIVPIYDFGSTDQFPCFIVMKYIEGMDLRRRLAESPPDIVESARLAATVASALHHAHKHGFVHRDLKPGNILLNLNGDAFIVDFGLALREADLGKGPRYAGTASYMSPEQARGEGHRVDGRSDIYNLGAVLYELLTGKKTVSGLTDADVLKEVKFREVRPPRQINDAVPKELERICLKALAKRASERYTTALDMEEDLQHFLANEATNVSLSATSIHTASVASSVSAHAPSTHRDSSTEAFDSQAVHVVPKGLRSFESHDADFFLRLLPGPRDRCGMPECIRFWKTRIQEYQSEQTFAVGVMYGPSGCGKSSLVKAGLLPQLSGDVIPVFVEATANNTEADLLSLLRRRWCEPGDARTLPEVTAALRRGEGPSVGRKILIVLDQFEQWLHATSRPEYAPLVEALRQCDGGRLQCLILVRDDFWLPISRFMHALEIRLIEGHNSALVDLFDLQHAKRVLSAFGRAYEKLPASRFMSPDQEAFLERAVHMLAEDGKVISVRLALFAEMVKERAWTPASLDALGGATGVGVAFLEQTFASPSAPPEHRLHLNAACKVLKALLPEVGVDIKGEMKSYATLLNVSGYRDRPAEFEHLMRLLDSELRLIAPTDPVIAGSDEASNSVARQDVSAPSDRFYQLTHDYLVHSLREWLLRKQKTTRRGRTELRLAERTALWKSKQESRLLPPWWEWLAVRTWTRPSTWTTDQRQMMRRKDRSLAVRGALIAACLLLILGVAREVNGHLRAQSLIETLVHAPTHEVPAIVANMAGYRAWIDENLKHRLTSPQARQNDRRQLHLRMALLPVDNGQMDWLVERLLHGTPQEVAAIRQSLAPHADRLEARLWKLLETEEDLDRRLRAACFLASVGPDDDRWIHCSDDILSRLVSENPLQVKEWVALLRPTGPRLLPTLARLITESRQRAELRMLAELYREFASDQTDGFQLLENKLANRSDLASRPELSLARAKANIAAALAIAERWSMVWPMMRREADPTTRSHLIALLGGSKQVSRQLGLRLASEKDPAVRQAIVLILGDLDDDRWSLDERKRTIPVLKSLQRSERDPGVKSAIAWTLQRWGTDIAMGGAISSSSETASEIMVLVKPGTLELRSSKNPPGQDMRLLSVPYAYEISRTEVTIAQFKEFRPNHASDRRAAPTDDCPVHEVSWFDAAAYCNWLSEQAQIPESQWCYAPNDEGRYAAGMHIKPDALQLEGFRLPTADEWEYACRAGTVTEWSMGSDVELLHRYGWSLDNSGIHSHPVGSLRPNHWGLFDMHGNVWEWCHDRTDDRGNPLGESADARIEDHQWFAMRGGTYLTDPLFLGSSAANWNPANKRTNADGFRVARTHAPQDPDSP